MTGFWLFLIVAIVLGTLISVFLDRVVNPRQRKRELAKFSKDFREGKIKPRHFDETIWFDDTGFGVKNDKSVKKQSRMTWSEVVEVSAYKRDLFSVDQVCVFLSTADQTGLEISEDMNNWMDFVCSLPKHLPGCKSTESWLQEITVPAFATNRTDLFTRQGGFQKQESAA